MKLIKSYWYSFLTRYHGNKALKIGKVAKVKNTALKYHKDMSDYYYKKVFLLRTGDKT